MEERTDKRDLGWGIVDIRTCFYFLDLLKQKRFLSLAATWRFCHCEKFPGVGSQRGLNKHIEINV